MHHSPHVRTTPCETPLTTSAAPAFPDCLWAASGRSASRREAGPSGRLFGLLGMASINLVLLAAADIYFGRGALSAVAVRPATLTQGVLSMILTSLVALVATVGAVGMVGIGAGSMVIGLAAIGALWLSSDFEHRHLWEAVGDGDGGEEGEPRRDERSVDRLSLYIGLCAVLIRTSGFILSMTADAIATTTGLAAGMVGFVLVGFATSLPELNSIIAALRQSVSSWRSATFSPPTSSTCC